MDKHGKSVVRVWTMSSTQRIPSAYTGILLSDRQLTQSYHVNIILTNKYAGLHENRNQWKQKVPNGYSIHKSEAGLEAILEFVGKRVLTIRIMG